MIVIFSVGHYLSKKWGVTQDRKKYKIIFHIFLGFVLCFGIIDFAILANGNVGERGNHVINILL